MDYHVRMETHRRYTKSVISIMTNCLYFHVSPNHMFYLLFSSADISWPQVYSWRSHLKCIRGEVVWLHLVSEKENELTNRLSDLNITTSTNNQTRGHDLSSTGHFRLLCRLLSVKFPTHCHSVLNYRKFSTCVPISHPCPSVHGTSLQGQFFL